MTIDGISRFSQLWLIFVFIQISISQAFTLNGVTKLLNSKGNKISIQSTISHDTSIIEGILSEEATRTPDFETRRRQRIHRLNQPRQSSAPPFFADFIDEEIIFSTPEPELKRKPKNPLGENFLLDVDQHNSILSDAPAILLQSGAGTGKSTVLSGRVAHLLRTNQIEPQNMIIISFTARDAKALKDKAMQMLYGGEEGTDDQNEIEMRPKEDLNSKLWCGTIHSFAINILRKYNTNDAPLRIVSTKEMKNRIRSCLGRINVSDRERLMTYKAALEDSRQSIGTLVNYMVRCLELWKEAGVLSTPYARSIHFVGVDEQVKNGGLEKDDYVELAMRLGIPQNAAALALEIADDYQTMHATLGTSDPSDVASIAYDFLISNPDKLKAVRSKLQQVVVDEYQDVSVSQHKLLRLIMLGADDNESMHPAFNQKKMLDGSTPVLLDLQPTKVRQEKHVCFRVPKIMCAGDCNQSIYGWRGAAPSLTVDGFRRDYPQGVVVPLAKNYRVPRHILNAANVLIGEDSCASDGTPNPNSFSVSPAAASAVGELAFKYLSMIPGLGPDNTQTRLSIGEKVLVEAGVISESSSSVFIQGLWDQREEAKFIAADIRKRSKQRIAGFTKVFNKLGLQENINEREIYDSAEVAVMVRSSSQLKMIEEALKKSGIPCIIPREKERKNIAISVSLFKNRQPKLLPMKPVKLITMHKAKGDEFDDVYLAGWNEGVFPHKSSLSSNRLHEERRIAYVALTRARQRVVLTYSFMKQVSYFAANGKKKDITEPVEPSRFLFNFMAGNGKRDNQSIEWSESYGFKESVAGKNLPSHYVNSYRVPAGFTKMKTSGSLPQSSKSKETETACELAGPGNHEVALRAEVEQGLKQIFRGKWGSKGKFRKKFRKILKECGIRRGSAVVLTEDGDKELNKTVDVLVSAPTKFLSKRALSRCTAEQLGLYIVYLLQEDPCKLLDPGSKN